MTNWQFLDAKLTLFPSQPLDRKAFEVYREVWSDDPDSFQSPPAGALGFVTVANGSKGPVSRSVSTQPGRVDLSLGPAMATSVGADMQVAFINSDLLLPAFRSVVEKLPRISSNRVACVFNLGQAAADTRSANSVICSAIDARYRPHNLTDEHDFVLQINEIFNSTLVPGIKYNLISKYSVVKIQTILVPGPAGLASLVKENTVPMITLDFNTFTERQSLEYEKMTKIVSELFQLACDRVGPFLT